MQNLVFRPAGLALYRCRNFRTLFRTISVLRGITTPPEATTFRDKITYVLSKNDKDLNEQLDQFTRSYPTSDDESVRKLAAHLCVPAQDLCASPFALRAAALAAHEGITVVHQELRKWPQLPKQEEKNVWEQGVLQSPTTNFHYDDMFATYNPNLEAKWTAYDFLTRYCKFYWRSGITRWELYIAAKLNQIIPTIHWHGLDQIKPTEQSQQINSTPSDHSSTLPLTPSPSSPHTPPHAPSNATHLKEALWHFYREVSKVEQEMEFVTVKLKKDGKEGGNELAFPWRDLDSSFDAMEYVSSHIARLNSEEIDAVLSSLSPTQFHFDDMQQYMENLQNCLETLLFGDIPIALDLESIDKKFYSRLCTDLLIREANFMLCDKQRTPQTLQEFTKTMGFADKGMLTAMSIFQKKFRPDTFAIGAGQFPLLNTDKSLKIEWNSLNQLHEGLTSSFPATVQLLKSHLKPKDVSFTQIVQQFASSPLIFQRAPLDTRFSAFLRQHFSETIHELVFDMLKFESAILNATESDPQIEQLATPIDEFGETDWEILNETIIIPSTAFKIVTTNYDVYAIHEPLTAPPPPPPSPTHKNSQAKKQNQPQAPHKNQPQAPQKNQAKPIDTTRKPSSYLVGLFAEEVAIISISPEWVKVWEWLTAHKKESVTCGDLHKKMGKMKEDELLGYLENFSQSGVIGLFPDA